MFRKGSELLRVLVFLVAFSTVAGALCTGYTTGNWMIDAGDICANASETIYLTGNLTVNGVLNLTDVTLVANTTYNGSISITVGATGSLNLNDTDGLMSTTNDACNITANNSLYRFKFESYGGLNITHSFVSYVGFSNNDNTINNFGIALFSNYSNVTYNNFSNMYTAVYPGSDSSWISFTNISYNDFSNIDAVAIRLQNGTNSTIEGNWIAYNAGFTAIYLSYGSHYNNVINNSFAVLTGLGVNAYLSDYNTIKNNTILGGTEGIKIEASHNSTLTNNTVLGSTTACIAAYDSENATIQNNTLGLSTSYGIYLNNATYALIQYNAVENGLRYGIYEDYSTNNTVFANTITQNADDGIAISFSNYTTVLNNSITLPVLTLTVGTAAIYVYDGYYNVLNNNTITKAAEQLGIGSDISDQTEFLSNLAYGNNTINAKQIRHFGVSEYACPNDASVVIGDLNTSSIIVAGCNNVTIADGMISNGDIIAFYFTNNSRINNATVNDSWAGAAAYYSENCSINNSTFSNNSYGMISNVATNTTMKNNSVTNTTLGAMWFVSTFGEFSYNNVNSSDTAALYAILSTANNFSYNNLTNNSFGAFIIADSDGNLFEANNLSYNSVAGAYVYTSKSNVFVNNDLAFNADGYWLTYAANNAYMNASIFNDRIYNNTRGIYVDNASGNNFTSVTFDNNSFHVEFNASNNNYVVNSTFGAYLTNQTLSNNSAYDVLLNNTGVDATKLGFEDATSNVTVSYFVNVAVRSAATGGVLAATVTATSQNGVPLYTLTSPAYRITPAYIAAQTPVNYTPHTFTASLAGYSSNTAGAIITADTTVTIYLTLLAGGSSGYTPSPTPTPTPTPSPSITPTQTEEPGTPATPTPTPEPTKRIQVTAPAAAATLSPTTQAPVQEETPGSGDWVPIAAVLVVAAAAASWVAWKALKK